MHDLSPRVPVHDLSLRVRVAGILKGWQKVRVHVTAAHFMCAGAVAWLTTEDVDALGRALAEAGLVGDLISGPAAGQRIGRVVHNEFEARVLSVLDPHQRFSAAPHSRR